MRIGNAVSQAGVGTKYEDRVAAWALAHLLLDQPLTLQGQTGKVSVVSIQAAQIAKGLDDVVVHVGQGDAVTKLLVQAKLTVEFTAGNESFREFITNAFSRFETSPTAREVYVLAYQENKNGRGIGFESLVDLSKWSLPQDIQGWLNKINRDPSSKRSLDEVKKCLPSEVTEDRIYAFLNRLLSVRLLLVPPQKGTADLLVLAFKPFLRTAEAGPLLWNALVSVASNSAVSRPDIDRITLLSDYSVSALYRDHIIQDSATKALAAKWVNETLERSSQARKELSLGKVYESLAETEALLGEVRRSILIHGTPTDSVGEDAKALRRFLIGNQGRAFNLMDYASESPQWLSVALDIAERDEDLWVQIGRVADSIDNNNILDKAIANLTSDSSLITLKIRKLLSESKEDETYDMLELLENDSLAEGHGILASFFLQHAHGDVERLIKAWHHATESSALWPERPLARLLKASIVAVLFDPAQSPFYSTPTVQVDPTWLPNAIREVDKSLEEILFGSHGVFEKCMAFILCNNIRKVTRNRWVPWPDVLETRPPFLERASSIRTVVYAQAMMSVNRREQAIESLKRKIPAESDEKMQTYMTDLLQYIENPETIIDRNDGIPGAWSKCYQLIRSLRTGNPIDHWELANEAIRLAGNNAVSIECTALAALIERDYEALKKAIDDLILTFPYAIECIYEIYDQLKEQCISLTGASDFVEPKIESQDEIIPGIQTLRAQMIRIMEHVATRFETNKGFAEWIELAINHDDMAQLHLVVETASSSESPAIEAFSKMGGAWLADRQANYSEAARLINEFHVVYPPSPSGRYFQDRVMLMAGQYRELTDRWQEMLGERDREPGTARFTVQAFLLLGDKERAIEVAKANAEAFPDNRIAMRDFIITALDTARLDVVPGYFERFAELFPDDDSLRRMDAEEGIKLLNQHRDIDANRWQGYESGKFPLHFLSSSITESWHRAIDGAEGLQARRLRSVGIETEHLAPNSFILLDITAVLAINRYDLWRHLGSMHLRVHPSVLQILKNELHRMRVHFNLDEYESHDKLLKLTEKPPVRIVKNLPSIVLEKLGESFNLGEAENALIETYELSRISSFDSRSDSHSLKDLFDGLASAGKARLSETRRWEQLLNSHSNRPHSVNRKPLNDPCKIAIEYLDLSDLSNAGIAGEVFSKLDEVVLGPAGAYGISLTTLPILWRKHILDRTQNCLEDLESQLSVGSVYLADGQAVPQPDEIDYMEEQARLSRQDKCIFWCDDAMVRGFVSSKSGLPAISTYQVVRSLFASGLISDTIYRDLLCSIGSDGHRDIDGNDLLTVCVEDRNWNLTSEFEKIAFRLGRSLNPVTLRDEAESEHERLIVANHIKGLVEKLPTGHEELLKTCVRQVASGAGLQGGSAFWPYLYRMLAFLEGTQSGRLLQIIDEEAAKVGQIDLAVGLSERLHQRATVQRPRLLELPSVTDFLSLGFLRA